MNVLGWLGDYSACGWYRIHLPFREHGWNVTDRAVTDADVVVAQRAVTDHATAAFQQVCADTTKTAVLELDDDLLLLDPHNPAHDYYSDPARRQNLIRNAGAADLVTVSTEPLAEVMRQYTDNIVVLPNYIPEALLDLDRPANERVVIGWAGSASHSRDFGELAQPLRRVLQKYRDRVEFHCMGTDYTHRVRSLKSRTRHTPWQGKVVDYYATVDFDIALAPLHASPFNAAKSDLRLKEMSALGIPTIASRFGPYATTVDQQDCPAILADSHKEWERALCDLIDDAEHRHRRGEQARQWAAQHTIESHAHQWADAYRSARA